VPALVKRINGALQRADQIECAETGATRDWMVPIVADAEAGFGGPLNAFELMKAMIEAGAAGPRERSRAWFAAGLANVKRDPGLALGFALRRALSFWRPWLNPQEHSMKVVVASAALNTALYALAAIGLWRRRRNDRFVVGWVVTLFFGVWLAHVPYQVVMRFRIPFTDPLLIALASGTIVRGFETARAPRRAERGPMRPV